MTNAYRPTTDRVHEQVALYEATDGREGGTLEGRPVVILSTIGAKTGNIRKNPVMRIRTATPTSPWRPTADPGATRRGTAT